MKERLTVQKNGVIGVAYSAPGIRGCRIANDVSFCIEWLANVGWTQLAGAVANPNEALREFQDLRRRHKTISYRLVAFNDVGRVRLPRSWRPF